MLKYRIQKKIKILRNIQNFGGNSCREFYYGGFPGIPGGRGTKTLPKNTTLPTAQFSCSSLASIN